MKVPISNNTFIILWYADPLLGNEWQTRFRRDGFLEANSLWNTFPGVWKCVHGDSWKPTRCCGINRRFRGHWYAIRGRSDQNEVSRSSGQNGASPWQLFIVSFYNWLRESYIILPPTQHEQGPELISNNFKYIIAQFKINYFNLCNISRYLLCQQTRDQNCNYLSNTCT
jgi:hypothetical protein